MKKTRQCPKCGEFGLKSDNNCSCCKINFIDKTIEIDIPEDFYKLFIKGSLKACQDV
ncbi:hypothetical protein QUF70_09765 [Desulfobacterales bacterium HSG17]|nr:hypothetical protein [Desulfobacterales bacterium HSG17]